MRQFLRTIPVFRMRTLLLLVTLLPICSAAQPNEAAKPLSVFLGHWEGAAHFNATPLSTAGDIHSVTDCSWSSQAHYLICEQTITDTKGSHEQLTIYTPSPDGKDFTYYTITGTGNPFTGKVQINGNTWTYNSNFEQDDKKFEVRTINTFNGEEESFKTEYSIEGSAWAVMLDGKSKRIKLPPSAPNH